MSGPTTDIHFVDSHTEGEPTRVIIIGATPHLKNAFLATGHNMLGLSLAASTGRLIAELATGEKPHIDATPFSPSRF